MSTPGHKIPQLPHLFEKVLLRFLKENYLKKGQVSQSWNARDTQYFAKGIVALNLSFTKNRAGKYRDYFNDPVMRSGYLAYFLPVNAMKAAAIFNSHNILDSQIKEIRIADLGAGPLTLTFGFLFHLMENITIFRGRVRLVIDAFELNKKILSDGISILKDFIHKAGLKGQFEVKINALNGNIFKQKWPNQKYDYLFLGNFLNEFEKRPVQWNMVRLFLNSFSKPDTKVLFIEPGSKKIARDLQYLRDELLEETNYSVLAPCLHQEKCPLNLTAKSDWCNFTQDWKAPQFIQDFDEITSLKKEYLLYSYLFIQNGGVEAPKHAPQEFVAISNLMKAKGRQDVIGCGPGFFRVFL